ncbi:MAG: hypothetical protein WB817_18290 [Terriglobales bacterium]
MHRWTARIALLVMLVPVFGPLAMAGVAPPPMQCCVRRPLTGASAGVAEPAMPCHHGSARAATAQGADSREHALRSQDCCGHCCCQNSPTSEWARPASNHPAFANRPAARAFGAPTAARVSSPLISADSARAPPRS